MYVNLYYLVWNIILDNIFVLIPECIVLDEQWREGKPYISNLLTQYDLLHVLYDYHESGFFPIKYVWKRFVNTHVEKSLYTNWHYRVCNDDELLHLLTIHDNPLIAMRLWSLSMKYPRMHVYFGRLIKLFASMFIGGRRYLCTNCETICNIIIHTWLLVAKIKSCIPCAL